MSRIDKALQAWEKTAGSVTAGPEPVAHEADAARRFGLNGYARELGTVAPAPLQPRPPEPSRPPAVHPQPTVVVPQFVVTPQVTPDQEARLVSGGSGAVPLEQYRRLAATLHDVQQQQGLKTLMLTSAL